jgi:DNA-binding transcriptional regulator YiaG
MTCVDEWRSIEGFPDYDVSSLGSVRSWKFNRWGRAASPRLLRAGRTTAGYLLVVLQVKREDGSWFQQSHYVHRLVAAAFIGPCPPGHEVNHKNSDRTDARAENLEYVTSSGNNIHAFAVGRMKAPPFRIGAANHNSKLTPDNVRAIRASSDTIEALAARYGISTSTLHQAKIGKTWKHVS